MATLPPPGDPRVSDPRLSGPRLSGPRSPDVRPSVAMPSRGLPWWMIAAGAVIAGVVLFTILDGRRRALSAPATKPRSSEVFGGAPTQPAPLYIPPEAVAAPPVVRPTPAAQPFVLPPPPRPQPQPRIVYMPPPVQQVPFQPQSAPVAGPRSAADPALVVDNSVGDSGDAVATGPGGGPGGPSVTSGATRVRATVMRNRATTVPQGTLIPAVLETALDSTRPGLARALVQSDVRGFDGSRVLIQRGSRLIGDYRADLRPGQSRALVTWTRLVRPDGVTIALNSPSSDPLGRAGIKGNVNTHFFQRFGEAILQSSLDVGVNLASRVGGDNSAVAIALPGAVQGSGASLNGGNQIQPTLTVRQGTPVGVFVARDLDFTAVERKR